MKHSCQHLKVLTAGTPGHYNQNAELPLAMQLISSGLPGIEKGCNAR